LAFTAADGSMSVQTPAASAAPILGLRDRWNCTDPAPPSLNPRRGLSIYHRDSGSSVALANPTYKALAI
jgi:hypothetical protein